MMSLTSQQTRSEVPFMNAVRRAGPLQGRCGMAASLVVGSLLLLLATCVHQARAQSSQGLFWQCVPADSTHPQPLYCPVNNTYPLPVNTVVAGAVPTPVAGTQRGLSIASATGFTVPAGATMVLVQAQGTNNGSGVCLYWQDDGTNPTNAAGQIMAAGQSMWYTAAGLAAKFIAASGATCTLTASYYK